MNTEDHKLENILIHQTEDQIVVAKRREHVVDGMVTGIIIDLLAFPLLLVGFVLGAWMIALTIIDNSSLSLIPMGIMFMALSAAPLYLLLWSQPAFFPYECRFRRNTSGRWLIQRQLGLLTSRWRELDSFSIVSRPTHSRGDWGYDLIVKTNRSSTMLTPPGVFTSSKVKARQIAEHDSKTVADCLGVQSCLEKWA